MGVMIRPDGRKSLILHKDCWTLEVVRSILIELKAGEIKRYWCIDSAPLANGRVVTNARGSVFCVENEDYSNFNAHASIKCSVAIFGPAILISAIERCNVPVSSPDNELPPKFTFR